MQESNRLNIFLLASTLLLWLSSRGAAQNLHWQDRTPRDGSKPPGRRGSALAWTPTALYLFGGENADGVLGDVWKFSLLVNEWSELRLIKKPAPRFGFVAGTFEDYWYISHGKGSNEHFDDTWVFDFTTEEWTEMNFTSGMSVPESRHYSAGRGVVEREEEEGEGDGDTMTIWMSMGVNQVGRKLSDTWTLTVNITEPFKGRWEQVSAGAGLNQYNPTLPHARYQAAGMPFSGGRFVINGGCSSGGQVGGPCPLEDTWVYYSSNTTWSRLSSCPIPAHSSSMVPLNTHVPDIGLIYGGRQDGHGAVSQVLSGSTLNPDEVTLINITSLQWSRLRVDSTPNGGSAPPTRSSPHMAPSAHGIYLFGGESVEGTDSYLNDLWLLESTGGGVPESLPCTYTWFSFLHLHGVLMYIAWGVLLPFGAMMGRYYRWSFPVWFVIHVICQVFGTILTAGGLIVVFLVAEEPSHPHGVIGIIIMISVTQQFISGLVRPWLGKEDGRYAEECKNKDTFKYKWRRCWEVYHRVSGIITVALGFIQVTLGVFLINAPVPVWGVWLGLLCVWLAVYLFHEIVHCTCVRLHKE